MICVLNATNEMYQATAYHAFLARGLFDTFSSTISIRARGRDFVIYVLLYVLLYVLKVNHVMSVTLSNLKQRLGQYTQYTRCCLPWTPRSEVY